MKPFNLILLSLLILTGITLAQNPIGINVVYRNDGVVTVASSTNPPSLVTTNLSNPPAVVSITTNVGDMYHPGNIITTGTIVQLPLIRVALNIQNTNSTTVNVYSDVNGSNLANVIIVNGIFSITWPISDTTQFYVRSSTTNQVSVIRSETWGR